MIFDVNIILIDVSSDFVSQMISTHSHRAVAIEIAMTKINDYSTEFLWL